jgi:hypothetical protein
VGGVTRSSSLPRVAVGGALWLHVHVDGVPLLLLFGWCCTGGRRDACYCLVSLKSTCLRGCPQGAFWFACGAACVLWFCGGCPSNFDVVYMLRLRLEQHQLGCHVQTCLPQLCWRRRCSCAVHAAGKPVWRCSWVTTKHTNSTPARSACCAKPSPIGDSQSATLSSAAGNRHDYRYRKPAGHTFSATRRGQHHERAEPLTCCARQRVARCTQPGTMLAEH